MIIQMKGARLPVQAKVFISKVVRYISQKQDTDKHISYI